MSKNGVEAERLVVRSVGVQRINPAPYNPRKDLKPGDPDYEALRRSIERWGLVEPLVWNERSGNLVGGHQRFKVLLEQARDVVDVSVVDLDANDEAALNVALNKIGGEWDTPKLAELLSELDATGFDATLTGFDVRELEDLLGGSHLDDPPIPDVPANPDSKRGEVYELGPHRLMCGDSTKAEHVAKLLVGVEPHLMVTDPPYGVDYDATWRGKAGHATMGANRTGLVANDDTADWSEAWVLFPGSIAYVWHGGLMAGVVGVSLVAAGFTLRSQIIWNKSVMAMGRGDYHWKHEPCWYAVRGTGSWVGDRKQTTVWDLASPIHIMGGSKEEKTPHPTQKPVECMRRPILNNSSPGQAVYDPFLGSGTTLIAAEDTQRICYGMEMDPGYCDVIRQRYEAL